MIPILFSATETTFTTNGLGRLSDAISCEVTEERNGSYELMMKYPSDGIHFADIQQRSIIYTTTDAHKVPQPFRVYRITKPVLGSVTIYAYHISYDLSGVVVRKFTAGSATNALQLLKQNSVGSNPFTFWTDKTTTGSMVVTAPSSLRSLLGGTDGSVLDVYGGEFEFDKFTVKLHGSRGRDSGIKIMYGKNLTDLTQEENCANCYTDVYPYWIKDDAEISGNVISAGTFDYQKIYALDCSADFDEQPTVDQLDDRARSYINSNNIGVPVVSLDVKFAVLANSIEYQNKTLQEDVYLCDTVTVEFEKLGVSARAKIVKTVWNSLLDRYESVEIGDAKTTIADTIAAQEQEIRKPQQVSTAMQQAINRATQMITGNLGGYVVIRNSEGGEEPNEILIMNTDSVETATKIWRWNNSGLGYSNDGGQTYGLAMTADGEIVADYITTGELDATLIKAGVLQSADGTTFKLDLDAGTLSIGGYAKTSEIPDVSGFATTSGLSAGTTIINGGCITTGTLSADRVRGGTIAVGGSNNTNGTIGMYNNSGLLRGEWDNNMLYIYNGINNTSVATRSVIGTVGVAEQIQLSNNGYSSVASIGCSGSQGNGYGTLDLKSVSGNTVTNQISMSGSNGSISCKSITVNGNTPVFSKTIGTFVYGVPIGDSTYSSTFVPIGVSGTFQLGSGSRYRTFYIDSYGNVSGDNVYSSQLTI